LIVLELAERRHAVNTCRERLGPRDQELLNLRYDWSFNTVGLQIGFK